MDSITHIVLGATLGAAMAGSKLKKRAMLFGAIAQSLPDIDVVASLWSDPAGDLLAHRGFTHSLLFVAMVTPLLAWCGNRWSKRAGMSFTSWCFFLGPQILLHIFLDTFNAYGTGWFEPFSHARLSFNVLFVADPLITIWLIISTVAILIKWNNPQQRIRWATFGLVMSGLYLVSAVIIKQLVDHSVEKSLQLQSVHHDNYFTTPSPFNSLLWYVVVADSDKYHIGYRSVLDKNPLTDFQVIAKNDTLLDPYRDRKDVLHLIRFSQGYYTVDWLDSALVFNDIRFGRIGGWSDPKSDFVFHYFLENLNQNDMVIQRGRFSNWNGKTFSELLKRIRGN